MVASLLLVLFSDLERIKISIGKFNSKVQKHGVPTLGGLFICFLKPAIGLPVHSLRLGWKWVINALKASQLFPCGLGASYSALSRVF